MNAAACSCRVRTSLMREVRSDSRKSRFSSPGTPKMRLHALVLERRDQYVRALGHAIGPLR